MDIIGETLAISLSEVLNAGNDVGVDQVGNEIDSYQIVLVFDAASRRVPFSTHGFADEGKVTWIKFRIDRWYRDWLDSQHWSP